MFFYPIVLFVNYLLTVLFVNVLSSVNGLCEVVPWHKQYDIHNQAGCLNVGHYITSLISEEIPEPKKRHLYHFRGAVCCSPNPEWDYREYVVVYTDWTEDFELNNRWVDCPSGYFLSGLSKREDWLKYNYVLDFSNIIGGRCLKPSGHPLQYGECYNKDIKECFSKKENCSCKDGYYVTGVYKSSGNSIVHLDKLRCCSMARKAQEVRFFEDLKTSVMEKTLWHMSVLADGFGYSSCRGNRGVFCGEDFDKVGHAWRAGARVLEKDKTCDENLCEKTLEIVFGNWGLEVFLIKYGQTKVENLPPEVIYSGTMKNTAGSPAAQSLELPTTLQDTLTHKLLKSFATGPELAVDLKFDTLLPRGTVLKYNTRVELSDSDVIQTSTLDTKAVLAKLSLTLQPNSSADYSLTVKRTKTTIGYTAVGLVKFSAELRGLLKRVRGPLFHAGNHHYIHQDSEKLVNFSYRFGDKFVPFYTALKKESESRSLPWLWDKISKIESVKTALSKLQEKSFYEFTVNGILEILYETKMDVIWS